MRFLIHTLGCKVNTYESEMMKEKLLQANFLWDEENPDIIIVNTCSVTNIADQKSKKMVRHFKKNHEEAILVVCGCSVQNKSDDYKDMGIDILIGNTEKSKIVFLIEEFLKNHKPYENICKERKLPFENMCLERFTTHTRAFIKIQDGCDNFCSYCIIPYVRGSIRSKDFLSIIEEANILSKYHQEIVLTGIHTGSYFDNGKDLTDVIHEISKIENIKRIRISSIEITELNDKFLHELRENPKICNHLHIPMQVGSDEILKYMNRKYDLKYFEEKISEIRKIRPDISLTTDIIVGHPYETEELFLKTIETAKKFAFSKIHVFPYSKREGTLASRMPNQVSEEEKKSRSRILNDLSKDLESQYAKSFLNKELEILVETSGTESVGCTSNYLKVKVASCLVKNTIVKVKITNVEDNSIFAQVSNS